MLAVRHQLEDAQEELMFVREVFTEFRESAAELETALTSKVHELEVDNKNLTRELEQVRAFQQMQS